MKKIACTLLTLVLSQAAIGSDSFDESVESMLGRYNNTKDVNIVSDVLVRCASLITITNSIKAAPNKIQIDPNELFISSLRIRSESPSKEEVSTILEEFRQYSKQYQNRMKTLGETGQSFTSSELKKEFEICDESAREFLHL